VGRKIGCDVREWLLSAHTESGKLGIVVGRFDHDPALQRSRDLAVSEYSHDVPAMQATPTAAVSTQPSLN
jgi:hypothetical protein